MKISDTMQQALNDQFREELSSGFIYLAMAAYFEAHDLPGFAKRLAKQAHEEHEHAMKIYRFLFERFGRAIVPAIPEPPRDWNSPLDALKTALKHEQHITGCINTLVRKARAEEDFATEGFLMWFVKEQIEEEQTAQEAVRKMELVGSSTNGVYLLDREFGL